MNIRILSSNSNTRTDVIAVDSHQVIVRRKQGAIEVECSEVTDCGNIVCQQRLGETLCYHESEAIRLLADEKGFTVHWYELEEHARWAWGASGLSSKLYPVTGKGGGKGWVVVQKREESKVEAVEIRVIGTRQPFGWWWNQMPDWKG